MDIFDSCSAQSEPHPARVKQGGLFRLLVLCAVILGGLGLQQMLHAQTPEKTPSQPQPQSQPQQQPQPKAPLQTPPQIEAQPQAAPEIGYRLGAGDIVRVTVYNQPELTTEAQIKESGQITFALIGEIRLGGLDKAAAESLIAQKLRDGGFIRQPQVNLLVTAYRSQQVSVLGEVNKPGRYPIESITLLTDLLAQAGGINPTTGGDIVTIARRDSSGTTTRFEIDVREHLSARTQKESVRVAAGDVIFVPRAPVFYVYGEVQKPGAYRLEKQMTVMQAISVGGGLSPRGTERGLRLTRRNAEGKSENHDVTPNDILKENDVVYVRQSIF
jgi:polysaccharide biosynthesis/export protein